MKHIFIGLLVLCLAALSLVSGCAESNPAPYFTLEKDTSIESMASDQQGGVYLLTQKGLFYLSDANHDTGVLLNQEALEIAGIVCESDVLYAITSLHEMLRFNAGVWEKIGKAEQYQDTFHLAQMTAGDGHIYYSFREEENNDRVHVMDFHIQSASFSEMTDFSCWWIGYDESRHVLMSVDLNHESETDHDAPASYAVLRYDPSRQQTLEPVSIPNLYGVFWQTCNTQTGTIYFSTTDNHVLSWNADQGLQNIAVAKRSGKMVSLSDGRVLLVDMDEQGRWFLHSVGQQHTTVTLTVQGYENEKNVAFTQQTGIDLRLAQDTTDMEAIAELMVMQNSEIDLFAVRTENGLNLVKDKGFFADLSQNAVLRDAAVRMYPAVTRPVMTENGMMAAFPVVAQPCFLDINAEALASVSIPLPQTWDDLLDVLPQVLDSDLMQEDYVPFDTIACNRLEVLQRFVRDYMLSMQINQRPVDFAQEDFRRIAERILREVPKEDPCPRGDEGTEEALFALDTVPVPIMAGLSLPLRVHAEDASAVFTSVLALVVNPYSKHQPEAFRYLEFLANLHDPRSYAHIASMTEPTFYPGQQAVLEEARARLAAEEQRAVSEADARGHQDEIERLREEVRELEQSCYMVSPKDIAWYQSVAPYLIATDQPLITADESFQTLVAQLAEGKMSLDQFAEKANANIRMREME